MPVAPTLPRAIAPPVGDMAISNIDAGASEIDLGSSAVVPRLVLREAPAREVLAVLAYLKPPAPSLVGLCASTKLNPLTQGCF